MKQSITFSTSKYPTLVMDAESIATIELTDNWELEIFTKDGFKRRLPFGDAFSAVSAYTALRIVLFENETSIEPHNETIAKLMEEYGGDVCRVSADQTATSILKAYQKKWGLFGTKTIKEKEDE